jgi:SAM-dependent methyltransferase
MREVDMASMNPQHDEAPPSPWVMRFVPLIAPGGRVLDAACGHGRHSRYLAGRGLRVEAVDRDPQAVAAVSRIPGVHAIVADLEGGPWPYPGRSFDGIVVANYLHRPLLPVLRASLAEGGVLIYETFAAGNERFGKPSNPLFLLQPGELLDMAAGTRIIAYEDLYVATPKPAMVQRICAVLGTPAWQRRAGA